MDITLVGVSFLVCTYNGASRIGETLRCLAQQAVGPEVRWEVVFVDNASTDGTAERARKAWEQLGAPAPLHMLQEPRPGKQHALETALRHVQYRYTCIVDDDNRLAPDYLQIGLSILEQHPQVGILGGPNTGTFEGPAPTWFPAFQHCYAVGPQLDRTNGGFAPLPDGNIGRNVLWGAGMFVRMAVWTKLHEAGFQSLFTGRQGEKNLTAGEDDELCYAAQLIGYEVWYSSRLQLQHHMAAGRLTEDYRNRLFYASARSATRLNAYRNALWGRQDAPVSTNLLKDFGYSVLNIVKTVFSLAFVRANLDGNYLARMNQWHTLVVVKDVLVNFGRVKAYYEQVKQLKNQLNGPTSTTQPTADV
jgi:glycosyltransferase involved in cell wall biosynthesis